MKNQKKILIIVPLFALILCATSISAQIVEDKIGFDQERINDFTVKYFKVKEVNNTLYFKFLVLEYRANTAYVLESSSNGVDFDSVKMKQGYKSPNNVPLLYCYSVHLNNLAANTYRIKRISPDGNDYSEEIHMNSLTIQNLSAQLSE